MNKSTETIFVLGLWHQGLVAAGVWAKRGFEVVCICESDDEARRFRAGVLPIYEPGLKELILDGMKRGLLHFETNIVDKDFPTYFAIMHDTEVNENDSVNVDRVFRDVLNASHLIGPESEVLICAQFPAGKSNEIAILIQSAQGFSPRVSYMPENLRLGQAIERFENPELPVIGISHEKSKQGLSKLFPSSEIEYCKILEAEILKSSLNTFLAMAIVFGNEISAICDSFGVDGWAVIKLLQSESRIGSQLPLLPGLPFSGGTLGRDVKNLNSVSKTKGGVIEAIYQSNVIRKEYFVKSVEDLAKSSQSTSIGLLGLTYKRGTSTLRRSLAIEIANQLSKKGLKFFGYDPKFNEFDMEVPNSITPLFSIPSLVSQVDLLVIMTPLNEALYDLSNSNLQNLVIFDPYGLYRDKGIKCKIYRHFGGRVDQL